MSPPKARSGRRADAMSLQTAPTSMPPSQPALPSPQVQTSTSDETGPPRSIGNQAFAVREESVSKKGRRSSRGAAFTFDDIDDEKVKKTTVVGASRDLGNSGSGANDGDQVMVVIPDLLDVEDEDMGAAIAAAPIARPKAIRTIGELEHDLAQTDGIASQMQYLSVPGIDLGLLIDAALCPLEQLEEPDGIWDWEIVFTQVSSEIQKGPADLLGPVPMSGTGPSAAIAAM